MIDTPYTLRERRYAAVLDILEDKHDTLELERLKRPIRFMMHALARKVIYARPISDLLRPDGAQK